MHMQNTLRNKQQLKNRKDGCKESCVITDVFFDEKKVKKEVNPKVLPFISKPKQKIEPPMFFTGPDPAFSDPQVTKNMPEDYIKFSYDDEEATDEGRTQEEVMEEIEKVTQMKMMLAEGRLPGQDKNCVFFNQEVEDGESDCTSEEDEDESGEEEGQFKLDSEEVGFVEDY